VGTTSNNPIGMEISDFLYSRRNYLRKAKSMFNTISWSSYAIQSEKAYPKHVHKLIS